MFLTECVCFADMLLCVCFDKKYAGVAAARLRLDIICLRWLCMLRFLYRVFLCWDCIQFWVIFTLAGLNYLTPFHIF